MCLLLCQTSYIHFFFPHLCCHYFSVSYRNRFHCFPFSLAFRCNSLRCWCYCFFFRQPFAFAGGMCTEQQVFNVVRWFKWNWQQRRRRNNESENNNNKKKQSFSHSVLDFLMIEGLSALDQKATENEKSPIFFCSIKDSAIVRVQFDW